MTYEVHLKQFEGPLDLLLHLIEQAEVDIKDIFVSEITAQYLEYMQELEDLDMDTASEFIAMAATLLYIKSRTLLPRPPKEAEEEEDPAEALIRQLRDYKAAKEAGERLNGLLGNMQGIYTKLPEEFVLPPQEITWTESAPDGLFAAFAELLLRRSDAQKNIAAVQEVHADPFTVRRQLIKIRAVLQDRQKVVFEELFEPGASKIEMIVTFMALLDMIMRSEVMLHQKRPYDQITITASTLSDEDEDAEYMDEQ